MRLTYRAIVTWPGAPTPCEDRRSSQFKADWHSTMQTLERELEHLDATNPVLELYVDSGAISLDGGLKGGRNVNAPGVILSFDSKHGPLRYPCDTFDSWRSNVRAIALGLERVAYLLRSSDSLAWSFTARRAPALPGCTHKSCTNCLRYALRWRAQVIRSMAHQQPSLFVAVTNG
jgi:hypothetical protein